MKVLVISTCSDPFSHTPMKVSCARTGLDCSENDLRRYVKDYGDALKTGQFSRIHIHLIDVNPETGEVSVEINRVGENPLKTKKVINPDAMAVREARLARAKERTVKPKASVTTNGFFAATPVPPHVTGSWPHAVSFDELGETP